MVRARIFASFCFNIPHDPSIGYYVEGMHVTF